MNDRINKTSICSVVFMDIIDYSKVADAEQIEVKIQFNNLINDSLKDIAQNDRIILDSGDGFAIAHLGSPEDALFMALDIRDGILKRNFNNAKPLFVRFGINLGPVRVVNDINGQPNIIGDGINLAQRIMNFAKPNEILVSRSYYEVTSRLTQEISQMFDYSGLKQDKHVREHEVYTVRKVQEPIGAESAVKDTAKQETRPPYTNEYQQKPAKISATSMAIINKVNWIYAIFGLLIVGILIVLLKLTAPLYDPEITLPIPVAMDKALPIANAVPALKKAAEKPTQEEVVREPLETVKTTIMKDQNTNYTQLPETQTPKIDATREFEAKNADALITSTKNENVQTLKQENTTALENSINLEKASKNMDKTAKVDNASDSLNKNELAILGPAKLKNKSRNKQRAKQRAVQTQGKLTTNSLTERQKSDIQQANSLAKSASDSTKIQANKSVNSKSLEHKTSGSISAATKNENATSPTVKKSGLQIWADSIKKGGDRPCSQAEIALSQCAH